MTDSRISLRRIWNAGWTDPEFDANYYRYTVLSGRHPFRSFLTIAISVTTVFVLLRTFILKDVLPSVIRIGLHCGPVVAGIVGRNKYLYDLWIDTVNLTARLQFAGTSGRINESQHIANTIEGHFSIYKKSVVSMKGLGPTPVYQLYEKLDLNHTETA